MPGMQISVAVDDLQVRELFAEAPARVSLRLRQLIEGAAIDVQREMRIAAPVAVTGQLRGSIRYTFSPIGMVAEIKPEAKYAEPVEYGSKPHFVSVAPGTSLAAWAKLKGINPFALQKSIAKKGTKPHPFVGPTYEKMKPRVEAEIAVGIGLLVEELNHGAI